MVEVFLDFGRFGEMQKKQEFGIPLQWHKNPENRHQKCPGRVFPPQLVARGIVSGGLGPWGWPRATQSIRLKALHKA